MARPSNTDERRQQIVEGLLKVMAARGYERASVAEVARAAGLTAGLVHYHFKDKQEILLGLVERLSAGLRERVEARLAKAGPGSRARLDAFLDAHLALGEGADPQAVAAWVALSAEAVRQPEVRQAYARVLELELEQLKGLTRAALVEAHGSGGGARAIAAALFAAIQGFFVLAAAAPGVTPPGSAAASARRMAAGLVQGGAPGRRE